MVRKSEHLGAVGQHHQRHDLAGLGLLEGPGQQQRRLGRSGVADAGGQAVGHAAGAGADLARHLAHGPGVGAGHHHLGDVLGREAGLGQCQLPRLVAEGDVVQLAEPLLPLLGPTIAGGAPAVEELLGDRRVRR